MSLIYCTYCRKEVEAGPPGHRCVEAEQCPQEPLSWPCEAELAERNVIGRTAGHGGAHGRRSGVKPGAP